MKFIVLTFIGVLMLSVRYVEACTRVVYKGPNNMVLTGRTMDFSLDIPANLWLFPRGMNRNGEVGEMSVKWTSKYGSVMASSWDIATPDGMNEKGLVANMLWLLDSKYPEFNPKGSVKGIAISLWAQYILDNFATVKEAVDALRSEPFAVVSDYIPGTKKFTTVHLSLSDPSGDNAVFEYIDGKLVIHHDPSFIVMTNDPPYEEQLAIAKYWDKIPGKSFLPGSVTSSDRFVRAYFFIKSIPLTDNPRIAVASVFSVIRNVSVPYGFSVEGSPNLSTTQWRVVADQKNLIYYFESVLSPNVIWVDFKNIDFSSKSGVRKLGMDENQIFAGEVSAKFVQSEPLKFVGL